MITGTAQEIDAEIARLGLVDSVPDRGFDRPHNSSIVLPYRDSRIIR